MAVILSSADDSVLKDAVKAKQHVKISDLVAGDTSTSFTRGMVHIKWPLSTISDSVQLKIILKSLPEDMSTSFNQIVVFLRGQYAYDCSDITSRDVLWLFQPHVDKAPKGKASDHSCLLYMSQTLNTGPLYVLNAEKASHLIGNSKRPAATLDIDPALVNASKKMDTPVAEYGYKKLAELHDGDTANVYGVVKFYKPPYSCKGTDLTCLVNLVDPSCPSGLKCMMFSREEKLLPQIRATGDILRVHRLKIQTFHGELQGVTQPGFSCVVIDGKEGQPIELRSGHKNITFTDSDKEKIESLREWAAQQTDLLEQNVPARLNAIEPTGYFDLTCQIVGMSVVTPGCCTILRIIDGYLPSKKFKRAEVEMQLVDLNLLPNTESHVYSYSADIYAYDNHAVTAAKLKPGQFICLHNCHAAVIDAAGSSSGQEVGRNHPQLVELCLHRGTSYGRGISVLEDTDAEVIDLKRIWPATAGNSAKVSKKQPITRLLLPNSERLKLSTIKDIVTHTDVPAIFHCQANIKSIFPRDTKNWKRCVCSKCGIWFDESCGSEDETDCSAGGKCDLHDDYLFCIVLTDPSGHLEVLVCREDSTAFVGDLHSEHDKESGLPNRLNRVASLLSSGHGQVDCLLKSYYDPTEQIRYRLFGTEIIVDGLVQ